MPLLDLALPLSHVTVPPEAHRFIREAERRIARFQNRRLIPGFVPSDYTAVYGMLLSLSETSLVRGSRLCEWGSGFGAVTCLAAMLDFDATGIEVEGALVEEARQLADDYEVPVEFAHGSFVPRGAEDQVHAAGAYSWLTTDGDYAYEDLGLELVDVDVVFAYPWPDEEGITGELFERYAGAGALLATYHASDDFRLRRKVRRHTDDRG